MNKETLSLFSLFGGGLYIQKKLVDLLLRLRQASGHALNLFRSKNKMNVCISAVEN